MTTRIEPEAAKEVESPVIGTVPSAVRGAVGSHGAAAEAAPVTARSMQGLADAPPITPRRKKPTQGGKWRRRIIMLAILAAAGVAGAIYWKQIKDQVQSYVNPRVSAGLGNIQTYTTKRGELRITMVEEGKLRATNNSTIKLGVNGKITWLAEAGAKVKKGDKLATIDTKQYEDNKRTMEGDLETQQKTLEIAEKQVPIAESNGKASVAAALTKQQEAEVALTTYKTIEVKKKKNDLETAVNDAKSKMADQLKKRQDLETQLAEMMNEGDQKTKLENDIVLAKQTEASLKRAWSTAEDGRRLYLQTTYPQEKTSKERAVDNAKLEVIKAQVQSENDLLSKQGDVQRIQNQITRIKSNIKQMDDYIDKSTARAPSDGLVFYGGPDLERYGISPDQIRVGADWYSNYPLMSIPDLSSFQVMVPVAEVYRGRVNVGMPASVIVDAVPGLVMDGKLITVSSVSRNKVQYDSSSPQVYDATLSLASADERLVAGMTVRVEINTANLPDVLFVPVEAVFNEEGKTAAFMWVEGTDGGALAHIEKRPVLTGQANDHFVEIKQGAKEGDKLLLSRPPSFVTPRDYRELADAMFPASAPATAPASRPASRPAVVEGLPGPGQGPATTPAGEATRRGAVAMEPVPATAPSTRPSPAGRSATGATTAQAAGGASSQPAAK